MKFTFHFDELASYLDSRFEGVEGRENRRGFQFIFLNLWATLMHQIFLGVCLTNSSLTRENRVGNGQFAGWRYSLTAARFEFARELSGSGDVSLAAAI